MCVRFYTWVDVLCCTVSYCVVSCPVAYPAGVSRGVPLPRLIENKHSFLCAWSMGIRNGRCGPGDGDYGHVMKTIVLVTLPMAGITDISYKEEDTFATGRGPWFILLGFFAFE